jgi:hypothetical protein
MFLIYHLPDNQNLADLSNKFNKYRFFYINLSYKYKTE